MRSHLFLAHSSFGILFKCNLNQFYGFQFNPSRLLLTSIVSSPSSSSCSYSSSSSVFSTLILKSSSSLFSQPLHRQTKLNFIPTRYYCENGDDHQINTDIEYEKLTVDKYKELISNENDAKLIEDILATYEILKYETGKVPSTLTVGNMAYLINLGFYRRKGYLLTLFNRELSRYRREMKPLPERHPDIEVERAAGKQQIMGIRFDSTTGAPLYGEWLNSHFLRLRKAELTHSLESNLIAGFMYGPKLVIDCDYDLNIVEARKIVLDIAYTIKAISRQTDPFNLILTGPFNQFYKKILHEMLESWNPNFGYLGAQIEEKHFLDLFPKEKIVYLSPYAADQLTNYDKNLVYILGGLPDIQSVNIRLGSLKKIKALGLKSYRLPLEDHFIFKASKRLSCLECVNILDHLSIHNNLIAALKHGVHSGRYKSETEIKKDADERTTRILKRSFRELRNQLENTKFT